MRPPKKFISEIIREFKKVFPITSEISYKVEFVYDLRGPAPAKEVWRGCFDTELPDWSPNFKFGFIKLSEKSNITLDEYGSTLVHELLHGYFKKVGGLKKTVEEQLCVNSEEALWKLLKRRLHWVF